MLSSVCVAFVIFCVIFVHGAEEARGMSAGIFVPNPNMNSTLTSQANHGIDVSTAITTDGATCLVSSFSFMVARGYRSSGAVDTNVCTSIHHAYNAGFTARDAYLFPCPTCSKSAATQVQELVDYLNANCPSHWSKRIWLDIEGSSYWTGDTTKNRNWYQNLVDACKNKSSKCGIYASASQWSSIFGSTSYKYGNDLPLWYAHYDGNANFDDFSSFGGWTTPHAKQFAGTTSTCSMSVDKNYAPSF
jgi:hypothetical protein